MATARPVKGSGATRRTHVLCEYPKARLVPSLEPDNRFPRTYTIVTDATGKRLDIGTVHYSPRTAWASVPLPDHPAH